MSKVLLSLLLLFFMSCAKEYRTPVFELRQLVKQSETERHSSGGFFLIGGSFNSSETQEMYIQVFAKVDGMYRFIKMNMERTTVNIDNTIQKPTIQIVYYAEGGEKSNSEVINDSRGWFGKRYIINCPEIYLPEKLLPISL